MFVKPRHARPDLCVDGSTYLGLLILIAIIGIASAATVQIGTVVQRRLAEEELLAIGAEFRSALVSYANATPVGRSQEPASLQDLLKDPRYPNPRRHLRKMYADPLTGKEEWGLVPSENGKGIGGIYSLAIGEPIKIGNFAPEFQRFDGQITYQKWVFTQLQ